MEQVYLTVTLVAGVLTILYLFLDDIIGAEIEIAWLNPSLILSFITLGSATGYILERLTGLNDLIVLFIGIISGLILTILFNIFVLVPLKSAEVSLAYTEESLGGQVGRVIVPIPVDGFGEVVIETVNGLISKSAVSYDNEEIPYDKEVLVVEVENGILRVKEYEKLKIYW